MHDFYRRDGSPYPPGTAGLFLWAEDLANLERRIVQQDRLANGYFVSTVWLGLDLRRFGAGVPLIFETVVFTASGEIELEKRYSTEADAIIGHLETVDRFAAIST